MSGGADELPLRVVCGQLLVAGFDGTTAPDSFLERLSGGERGGAILFRRNIPTIGSPADPKEQAPVDIARLLELNRMIVAATPYALPPLIGVDQEGGRVSRLGPPFLQLPSMRTLSHIARQRADAAQSAVEFVAAVAKAVGREIRALGFNMNFAPVLDVDSNPGNPVIGDRAFGADAAIVASLGGAFARGLADAGILACGKHFPGHGDTELDSHLALPRVAHARARLDAVELTPFRVAAAQGVPAFMTSHVVYDALDSAVPATLSPVICTALLRDELGFRGVLISDDLCMKGVSPSGGQDPGEVGELAVRAVAAGCDVLLICHAERAADAAHGALVERAERDRAFAARCRLACARVLVARRAHPPEPGSLVDVEAAVEASRALGVWTSSSGPL